MLLRRLLSTTLVFVLYWCFFFGDELLSICRLYLSGRQIFHAVTLRGDDAHNKTYVPMIMHRMWKDDSIIENENPTSLPVNWTKAFAYCNKQYQMRNWTTYLWTDESIEDFLEKHYPAFIPTFKSYPYNIQRVDAARYFILHHFGGVYMDLDVGCQKNKDLADISNSMGRLNATAALPLTQPVGFSNDVLFATKGSPFFKELIDALPIKNKWFATPYLTVMFSTGPMFLSLQYLAMLPSIKAQVLAIPEELYTERGTRYFKHLRGSTWHGNDVKAIQWMTSNKCVVLVLISALVIFRNVKQMPKHEEKIR